MSHSDKEHNHVNIEFIYNKGDVIKVMRNGDELVWFKESQQKEFRIKATLTEEEWG